MTPPNRCRHHRNPPLEAVAVAWTKPALHPDGAMSLSKRKSSPHQENGRALTMRALRLMCRSSSRTPVNLHCEWLNVRCGLPRDCALSHICSPSAPAGEPAEAAECKRQDVARNALICDDARRVTSAGTDRRSALRRIWLRPLRLRSGRIPRPASRWRRS